MVDITFKLEIRSSGKTLRKMGKVSGERLRKGRDIIRHLLILRKILNHWTQLQAKLSSVCKSKILSGEFILRKILILSENKRILAKERYFLIEFTNRIKIGGLRWPHWVTPRSRRKLYWYWKIVFWKSGRIVARREGGYQYQKTPILKRTLWSTMSNVFLRSVNIASTIGISKNVGGKRNTTDDRRFIRAKFVLVIVNVIKASLNGRINNGFE